YEGIGVSLPGRIDPLSQRLIFSPSLGWGELDIKAPLERATGLPVQLENAANACALAELWSGRHTESVKNLVTVTVSEDIGVGMILNGQLVQGATGVAGEFGHVRLAPEGPACRCGNRGCWEMYASNSAAVRYYVGSVSAARNGGRARAPATPPTFDDLLRLAEQNDAKATAAVNKMAHYLGQGIALLVTGLAPDVIVVVGDVARVWDKVGPVVDRTVKDRSVTHAGTRIVPADPAAQPRLRGTVALVLQKHFGAPTVA
ncbi:MAG TPA: ROK family protein, partial [Blastocatellia bacterium]|nr:ROK family protein [Blastocatellia bacterium]